MRNVIEILRRNSNIKTLLGEFKLDFEDVYYGLSEKDRDKMLEYSDIIFRKWLYSPLLEGTYITPNLIINSIAQEKSQGNYSIVPYVKININTQGTLVFSNKFIYCSQDNSPVMEDLEKVINCCKPVIITRDENKYVLDKGEKLVGKITFKSDYYIEYLIDIAVRIGILDLMKSICCKCYKKGKKYDEYFKLSNEEKVEIVIEKSIEMASERLKEVLGIKSQNGILTFLDNGVTEETYFDNMELVLQNAIDFVNDISEYSEDQDEIINITIASSILGDKVGYWLIKRDAGVDLDINFSCIFGYYLGMINTIYDGIFLPHLFMELINYSRDPLEQMTYMFTMEKAHSLTKFGEYIVKKYKKDIAKSDFENIILNNIKNIIAEYKKEKQIIIDDIKRNNGEVVIMNNNNLYP